MNSTAIRPKFTGARFDAHALPVSCMKDLIALEEIYRVLAIASWVKGNPDRQRIPRNFREQLTLSLRNLEEGSVVCNMVLPQSTAKQRDFFDNDILESAKKLFLKLLDGKEKAKEALSSIPNRFRPGLAGLFDKFGRGLREDEKIIFENEHGNLYEYNNQKRLAITELLSEQKKYTKEKYYIGFNRGMHNDRLTVDFETVTGESVSVIFGEDGDTEEQRELLHEAFPPPSRSRTIPLALYGIGYYTNGQLKQIKLSSVDILEEGSPVWQLERLKTLEKGWLDGEGSTYSNEAIDALQDRLEDMLNARNKNPAIFPLADGGVSFEWNDERYDISLEVAADLQSAYWHNLNKADGSFTEADLKLPDDWEEVMHKLEATA